MPNKHLDPLFQGAPLALVTLDLWSLQPYLRQSAGQQRPLLEGAALQPHPGISLSARTGPASHFHRTCASSIHRLCRRRARLPLSPDAEHFRESPVYPKERKLRGGTWRERRAFICRRRTLGALVGRAYSGKGLGVGISGRPRTVRKCSLEITEARGFVWGSWV